MPYFKLVSSHTRVKSVKSHKSQGASQCVSDTQGKAMIGSLGYTVICVCVGPRKCL